MHIIFLAIYNYFSKRRALFYAAVTVAFSLCVIGLSKIKIEEDITRIFPRDSRVAKLTQVFQGSKFSEKLVFSISLKDTLVQANPDQLIDFTETLVHRLDSQLGTYIREINYSINDQKILESVDALITNLPIYLDASDYKIIDSLIQPVRIQATMDENYRTLVSPTGIVLKKIISRDPLGISKSVLGKLQQLQVDDGYKLYNNFIFTRDERNLLFFVVPSNPANETGNNMNLIDGINEIVNELSVDFEGIKVSYFGATAVAVGNAYQLRQDTYLTLGLMIFTLIVFLSWFFKRKLAPLLILIPVLFGGMFSLTCVYLIQGSISVIAIAAGSIILGIAVNYSLHFLSHLRYRGDIEAVIRDLSKPMTLGSATTVLAFFFLQFANAEVLQDMGLFAGFSLIGAAIFTLIFLPHMVAAETFYQGERHQINWVDKMSLSRFGANKILVSIIFLATPVFFYLARDVQFNSDMNKLNYMSEQLRIAQNELADLNEFTKKSIYIISSGPTLDKALQANELLMPRLDVLKNEGLVQKITSVSDFVISDSLRKIRSDCWNQYWTEDKKEAILNDFTKAAENAGFKSEAFFAFTNLINNKYSSTSGKMIAINEKLFEDFITQKEDMSTVVTLVQIDPSDKDRFLLALSNNQNVLAIDKQSLTSMFVEFVQADFNLIVLVTSIIVFFALLLVYGRIELTLITFLPMLITWIWILGIMGLTGIEFNIINVMISTFIFGLGDDYSIFIMDGLQQEYRFGRKHLPAIKTSIFLSAFTTIVGLGVLLFASHPALRSIAAISVIGICCVFVMSQTVEPFLFSTFISARAKMGLTPVNCWGLIKSVFAFSMFAFGSFLLTSIGFILVKVIPFRKAQMRLIYHSFLSGYTRMIIYTMANLKKRVNGFDPEYFAQPHIIICNHQSFLDILVTTMLHPRIVLLTNNWVWNSPIFGGVVRLANYYPVIEGTDNTDRLRACISEGYSIVVFPEGTRSKDGTIGRFHKGAFYLAEKFNLPILPLILHGTGELIRKNDFYVNDGPLTLTFLAPIKPDNLQYGSTYQERTKAISSLFRQEYDRGRKSIEDVSFYRNQLLNTFKFKGPVLEWYLRIKLKLEKNYESFDKLVPLKATILDLGCGYGFLSYMLHYLSKDRIITAVDHDLGKIETAIHGYSRASHLNFECADLASYSVQSADVMILNDVLHYLSRDDQNVLLAKCFKNLNRDGRIIIRDGDKDAKVKHQGTKLTELFSVDILQFNKTSSQLNYLSRKELVDLAERHGYHSNVLEESELTSNTTFVFERRA
ncbi:MAG: 1-acyl-sn-glycerol-3-phosphate acyltransferase [Cyclobacteriaceae bacterium]